MHKNKLLFVCIGNRDRSPIARRSCSIFSLQL
jgi:protein-tyrosine-phosphatase